MTGYQIGQIKCPDGLEIPPEYFIEEGSARRLRFRHRNGIAYVTTPGGKISRITFRVCDGQNGLVKAFESYQPEKKQNSRPN